jgi:hypothetical protein
MLVLIGSHALATHMPTRTPRDMDVVGSYDEIIAFKRQLKDVLSSYPINSGKKQIVKTKNGIYECEVAWENSTSEKLMALVKEDLDTKEVNGMLVPSLDILYMLKMTHRYLKNSPHFLKTMGDILAMRELGAKIRPEHMDFFKLREKETYNYQHPKLNVNKKDFFSGDGVEYIYDHDTIHESTKSMEKPAYAYFKPDESEVFCSREMFYEIDESIRLAAVFEESQVLALERSQIPFGDSVDPKKSFDIALAKVCTSITSGWFREYAWENYHKVQALYNPEYVNKFWQDVENGIVRKLPMAA